MSHREMIRNGRMAERALRDAFAKLVRERRKTGGTLILWKNGKVVEIPAKDIPDSALRAKLTIK